ncbi:MAG: hypothetical protein ABI550_05145 [Ignavibacteriaceae bacterium]
MKSKIFLALFVHSFSVSFAQECKAKIDITTDRDSAQIFLDDKFVGSGNIILELNNGNYNLKVTEGLMKWNAQTFIDSIKIKNCEDKQFNYSFETSVYLQTDPQDVYVYSKNNNNNELIGHTPLILSKKFENLMLKKDGYEDKNITLGDLKYANTISLIKANLDEKKASFFTKDVFKMLMGSLLVLGGTTAYFKLKADDKFEEYQFTGNGELLHQTRKFDLISGITFGLVQINFGILMYYFLFD